MGILGDIVNKTKDDLKYSASSELGYEIKNSAKKGLEKLKGKRAESGEKKCPKCNIDFPIGTKFCGQCGNKLKS